MLGSLVLGSTAGAFEGRVIKVLPQFLDKQGRHALTPSLYARDAYQAQLRLHPAECSGLRFAVDWWSSAPKSARLVLRVELRGVVAGDSPKQTTLEMDVHRRNRFGQWDAPALAGGRYQAFGEVTAWRVTLWEGDQLLAEQKSFLW